MDLTEQLAEQKANQDVENSEGASALQDIRNQEKLEEEKRQNGKFQSAFQGTDLNSAGIPPEDYDYEKEFNDGNSLKPDENGGIDLSNKNIKPGVAELAGYDFVTGQRFKSEYPDEEGYIKEGLSELQQSKLNTKTGTPHEDMLSLTKIAKGIDGTYDDFLLATPGPWSDQQRAVAWDSKVQAERVLEDVKTFGKRYMTPEEGEKTEVPYRSQGIEVDIDETELVSNPVWISSGRKFVDYFNPGSSEGMSDEEIHDFNLTTMSQFNWNLPMMMFMTDEIVNSGDKELAQAFLFMMDQNDATDVSMASVGRGIGGAFGDVTTYLTVGGGIIVSRLTGAAIKNQIKKTVAKVLTVTAMESSIGATIGAIDETSRQTVEGTAGEREELDTGKVGKAATIAAGVNVAAGLIPATIADPALRKFGGDTVKKATKGLINNMAPSPSGMGLSKQTGAITLGGTRKFTPATVEFKSKLIEELDKGIKGKNISTKKLKNKLTLWVNEGKIKQQEIDWSGLNAISADNVSIDEVRAIVDTNRPVPSITPVAENRFDDMVLSADTKGYRELVINIDKTGTYEGPPGHFGGSGATKEGQAAVGHLRMSDTSHGGTKGTMLLEGQSDIRKVPRNTTFPKSNVAKSVKKGQKNKAISNAQAAVSKSQSEWESNIIEIGNKYNLNPQSKNYEFQVMNIVNESERAKLDKLLANEMKAVADLEKVIDSHAGNMGSTPFTPFRDNKSSNELLFRSAVMDAMNNDSGFLAWPKSYHQVNTIEKWGELSGEMGKSTKRIAEFYEKELPKIAKRHGFKVEEFVPDEFKGKTRLHGEYNGEIGTEKFWDTFDSWLLKNKLEYIETLSGHEIKSGNKVIHTFKEIDDLMYYAAKELAPKEVPFEDNVFYRIVFDSETKTKWKQDGAAMYSFGAPIVAGVVATGAKKQERDKDGKFK